jgi:hypothetical protein
MPATPARAAIDGNKIFPAVLAPDHLKKFTTRRRTATAVIVGLCCERLDEG